MGRVVYKPAYMQDLYVTTLLHVWPMNKCVCDKEVPVPDEYRCYDESLMMWPAVPYGQPKYHHPTWSCSIHQRKLHLLQRVQILPGDPACIHLLIQMNLGISAIPSILGLINKDTGQSGRPLVHLIKSSERQKAASVN